MGSLSPDLSGIRSCRELLHLRRAADPDPLRPRHFMDLGRGNNTTGPCPAALMLVSAGGCFHGCREYFGTDACCHNCFEVEFGADADSDADFEGTFFPEEAGCPAFLVSDQGDSGADGRLC